MGNNPTFSSWTNGKKEGDERIQQWTNYSGATGNYTADGLTAENLIAKDLYFGLAFAVKEHIAGCSLCLAFNPWKS